MSYIDIQIRDCESNSEAAKASSFGGRWSKHEDQHLRTAIESRAGKRLIWTEISASVFRGARSGPQCQSRWEKVIKPGLVKGPWSTDEDMVMLHFCHILLL